MADSNNINNDGEKLLSYYNDELSGDEKHKLEEQMLEDGFMADAAEGLGMVDNPAMLGAYIAEINNKFSPQKPAKSPYMAIVANTAAVAASVTVLIGAAYFISDYVNQSKPATVAEKAKAPTQPSIGPATDGGQTIEQPLEEGKDSVYTGLPKVFEWNAPIKDYKSTNSGNRVFDGEEVYEHAPAAADDKIGYLDYSNGAPPNKSYTYSPNYPDGQMPVQTARSEDMQLKVKKKDITTKTTGGVVDNYGQPEGVFIDGKMVKAEEDKDMVKGTSYSTPKKSNEVGGKTSSAYNKGVNSYNNGKYKAALNDFEDVLKTDPSNQKALYYAGLCNSNLSKYDKAISFYNKIPAGCEYYENALWEKAKIYKSQGKTPEAIKTLQEVVKLNGTMKIRAEKMLKEFKPANN